MFQVPTAFKSNNHMPRLPVKKIIKIGGISLLTMVAFIFLLPELFPGIVAKKIKGLVNENIDGSLDFRRARLSFIRHFPALTLSLTDFSLKGSSPYKNDTLLSGRELAFGIDLSTLFRERLSLNQFFLEDALISIQVDSLGNANYNIIKAGTENAAENADESASLRIERIEIKNTRLIYNDRSLDMLLEFEKVDYTGKGDLTQELVDLQSNIKASGVSFSYDKETYAVKKDVSAELLTRINTGSLELSFTKNDLMVNQLPVKFTGFIRFPETGYDIYLDFKSKNTGLAEMISVLPPEYLVWLNDTRVSGKASLDLRFAGKYRVETNENPTLTFGMQIKDGMVQHAKAPVPITNINLSFALGIPNLSNDSFYFDMDTFHLNIDKGYFRSNLHIVNLNNPLVRSSMEADADLDILQRAAGFTGMQLKGQLLANATVDGTVLYGQNPNSRFPQTVLLQLPQFHVKAGLRNGFFKMDKLPLPVHHASFDVNADCPTGLPDQVRILLDNLDLAFGESKATGYLHYNQSPQIPINAALKAVIQLEDIAKCVPIDSVLLGGNLDMVVNMKGDFDVERKKLPVTNADIHWQNGLVKTAYYPAPIEDIDMLVKVKNTSGNYRGLDVEVQPIHFVFEGHPFMIKADVKDLENVRYDVISKGRLDIGKISKVFVPKEYGVSADGLIISDLRLRGSQADALAGRLEKLNNSGTLILKNVSVRSEDFPYPLVVESGNFHANQDKLVADNLKLTYGRNKLNMKGFYQNLFPYLLGTGPLMGGLSLDAQKLYLDDFLANTDGKSDAVAEEASPSASGVIMVPKDLSLQLYAEIKEAYYEKYKVTGIKGAMVLDSGRIMLKDANMGMAGAKATLNALYHPISPAKALFDVRIKADSFDVQRFYKEVPLFAEMAPSAAKASGQVSMQYQLGGRLDANMMPVMPSLQGGGTLSLHNVQVNGLKLFSAVSKATGRDSINNPNLKQVDIKTSIANNVMTIERTRMRIFGFRPRMEGQATLDGKLNLQFRLGLPPFGIIGIPMSITGTSENPVVNMRRGKEEDELDETEDEKN